MAAAERKRSDASPSPGMRGRQRPTDPPPPPLAAGQESFARASHGMAHLHQLNEEQRAAVTAPLGPVRVMAGPGSGKVSRTGA